MRYTPRSGRALAVALIAIATFAIVTAPADHHPVLVCIARIAAVLDYALAVVHLRIAHTMARRSRGATSTDRT
jgi:hypothetical protein